MARQNNFEIIDGEGRGRAAVMRLKGHLDATTAPQLLERAALVQAQGRNLVLNLSEVEFLDSSGVGAMLLLSEQFQEQAGAVRFAALSDAARMVVELLDLDRFLKIDATEADALAVMEA